MEEGAAVEEVDEDGFAPREMVLGSDDPCLQAASERATIIAAITLAVFTARVILSIALSSEVPDLAPIKVLRRMDTGMTPARRIAAHCRQPRYLMIHLTLQTGGFAAPPRGGFALYS